MLWEREVVVPTHFCKRPKSGLRGSNQQANILKGMSRSVKDLSLAYNVKMAEIQR